MLICDRCESREEVARVAMGAYRRSGPPDSTACIEADLCPRGEPKPPPELMSVLNNAPMAGAVLGMAAAAVSVALTMPSKEPPPAGSGDASKPWQWPPRIATGEELCAGADVVSRRVVKNEPLIEVAVLSKHTSGGEPLYRCPKCGRITPEGPGTVCGAILPGLASCDGRLV